MHHILVPLDGSSRSERAIAVVDRLAEALGAEVTLLRVVDPADLLTPLGGDIFRGAIESGERLAAGYLFDAARRFRRVRSVSTQVLRGMRLVVLSTSAWLAAAPVLSAGLLQPSGSTQTSEGGQVTVSVTWPGSTEELVFAVVMDTHAVDLDGYDLLQLAVLRTAAGVEIQPTSWNAPAGGHHREGTLSFPTTSTDGNSLIDADTSGFDLAIRDVARVPERVFRWEW